MTRSIGGSHALSTLRQNMGPTPFKRSRVQRRSAGFSQADTRRPMLLTDQHGRAWSCHVENKSGMPTGLICNDFSAPWLPEQCYLAVNPENPSELWIDYLQMWNDRSKAWHDYHKLAVGLAADKKWEIPKPGKYTSDYIRILGDPPKPLQVVKAAASGNPWILGESDVVDVRLVEFCRLPDAVNLEFDDDEDYSLTETANMRPDDEEYEGEDDEGLEAEQESAYADDDLVGSAIDGLPEEEDDEPPYVDESLAEQTEELADAAATGGKTVKPGTEERVARQAPRPAGQTSKRHKRGRSRSRNRNRGEPAAPRTMKPLRDRTKDPRPSLASGAKVGVSSVTNAHEYERPGFNDFPD